MQPPVGGPELVELWDRRQGRLHPAGAVTPFTVGRVTNMRGAGEKPGPSAL
jgi:hypothetical protein